MLSHPSRADIKDFVLSLCLVPALTLPQAPGSRGLRSTLSVSQSPSPSVKLKSQHGTGPLVPSIQAICHILIALLHYCTIPLLVKLATRVAFVGSCGFLLSLRWVSYLGEGKDCNKGSLCGQLLFSIVSLMGV